MTNSTIERKEGKIIYCIKQIRILLSNQELFIGVMIQLELMQNMVQV